MKRSKKITLSLIGGATPFFLIACDSNRSNNTDSLTYTSIDACVQDNEISEAACKTQYNKAWQRYLLETPRYTTQQSCETDFTESSCQQLSTGEYIPTMEGFIVSFDNSSGGSRSNSLNVIPLYLGGLPFRESRQYRNANSYNSGYINKNNRPAYSQKNTIEKYKTDEKFKAKPSLKSTTMKRGGFGRRSTARGRWGG